MKKYLIVLLSLILVFLLLFGINFSTTNPKINHKQKQMVAEKTKTEQLKDQYKNNDIIGEISIPNSEIKEPLLQSSDNSYYLTHDNYGNYDMYGSIFLDHRCNNDSKKLLIFGHNDYHDKTAFSDLENYYNESYFKEHQYIDVMINDQEMHYQIFSVYVETEDFTYMNLNIDQNQYTQDLIAYKSKSIYNTNNDVSPSDNILILQTCSNLEQYKNYQDKYLLLIAKQLSNS